MWPLYNSSIKSIFIPFSIQELSRGKTEALKLMDEDMGIRLEELRKEKDAQMEVLLQKK